MLVTAQSILVC